MPCSTCENLRKAILPKSIADKLREYERQSTKRRALARVVDVKPQKSPPAAPRAKG